MRQCAKVYFQSNGDTKWSEKSTAGLTCNGEEIAAVGESSYSIWYISGNNMQNSNGTSDYPTTIGTNVHVKQ